MGKWPMLFRDVKPNPTERIVQAACGINAGSPAAGPPQGGRRPWGLRLAAPGLPTQAWTSRRAAVCGSDSSGEYTQ